jgi:hypothetical protein
VWASVVLDVVAKRKYSITAPPVIVEQKLLPIWETIFRRLGINYGG